MATLNIGMKVNRAITGATTVTANAVAVVSYQGGQVGGASTTMSGLQGTTVLRVFGPGQSIPASYTGTFKDGNGQVHSVTFSLLGGFELINTI